MKLTFLGTGAVDWDRAEASKGEERGIARRCTSVLVNDDLLVDPNPDVPEALKTFGCDMRKIRYILISHSHSDHYCPETLIYLADDHRITVYGDPGFERPWETEGNARFVPVETGIDFKAGEYTVRAVKSTHSPENPGEQALHYAIDFGKKSIFYGCDGAWFISESFSQLAGRKYLCVILDATFGDDSQLYRVSGDGIFFCHNNPTLLRLIRSAFLQCGFADRDTVFVADHLAKTYFPSMEKARLVFEPMGMTPAYDGMILEV
ncbi:MAG: MBL fold metallo-hydrolase [Clostridiales bacterium]|nr:MBL fold metallo-hydrolase [Clostridiales bacterium]